MYHQVSCVSIHPLSFYNIRANLLLHAIIKFASTVNPSVKVEMNDESAAEHSSENIHHIMSPFPFLIQADEINHITINLTGNEFLTK